MHQIVYSLMRGKRVLTTVFMGAIVSLLLTSVTATLQQQAEAQVNVVSHFRYNHINWTAGPGTNQATFDFDFAMRRNGCGSPGSFSPGDTFAQVGDICIENVGGSSLDFGDGSSTPTIWIRVTAIDVGNNVAFGNVVEPATCAADGSPDGIDDTTCTNWVHQYLNPGPFTAEIASVARTGVEINNPNQNYRIATLVDFNSPPANTGSPVSVLPPIVQCPLNGLCTFQVPGVDPDGDNLTFRLSTDPESGILNQPGAGGIGSCTGGTLAISTTGVVSWTTTDCVAGLYSSSLRIEENNPGAGVHGFVMVDYLIQLATVVSNPPIFDVGPMSPDNTVFFLQIGVPFNTPVQCSDADALDVLTLGNLGLPGTSMVSAPVGTNPVSQTFSWTPGIGDVGPNLVTFTCSDGTGNSAMPHDYTLTVQSQPPVVGGEFLGVDSAALLLAGAQMNAAWMIPVIVSGIGFAIVIARKF